jgi:hypothetical protein
LHRINQSNFSLFTPLQSYRASIEAISKRFGQDKREQENYFRILQGVFARALRLHMLYTRQNTMLFDVYTALKRRKEAVDTITADVSDLKRKIESSSNLKEVKVEENESSMQVTATPEEESASAAEAAAGAEGALRSNETSVLKVKLSKSGKEVTLYRGQHILTPMGDGKITAIRPGQCTLVIQLPFGIMYANIRRAVCWGTKGDTLDLASDETLRQKWKVSKNSLVMAADVARSIRSLVGSLSDDEATTDKDDDLSADDPLEDPDDINTNTTATGSAAGSATASATASAAGVSSQQQQSGDHIQGFLDSNDGTGTRNNDVAHSSKTDDHHLGIDGSAVFPLLSSTSLPKVSARPTLQKSICYSTVADELSETRSGAIKSVLPLAFAPAGALPYFVERGEQYRDREIIYCPQALADVGQIGTVGSLAWAGSIEAMKK